MRFLASLVEDDIAVDQGIDVRFAVADITDAERGILDAIVRYRNGVVVDLEDYSATLETTVDPGLVTRFSAAMRAVGIEVEIEQTESNTLVSLGGSPAGSSKGLSSLAGAVTLPFMRAVRAHELVVAVYDEVTLDPEYAEMLWNLFSDHLGAVPIGELRRIVIVARSVRLDHDLHLRAPAKSARSMLFRDQVTLRRTWEEIVHTARTMLDGPPMVLFLAAGFSASSKPIPLGDELRDHAIAQVVGVSEGHPKYGDYRVRLRDLGLLTETEEGMSTDLWVEQLTFERVMKAELPSWNHDAMALPAMRYFVEKHDQARKLVGPSVILLRRLLIAQVEGVLPRSMVPVTVNFDELLEEDETLPIEVFASEGHFATAAEAVEAWLDGTSDRVPYLKLHGTVSDPPNLIVSTTQTEVGLNVHKRELLVHLATRCPRWVYVGASMRDRDLHGVIADLEINEDWISPSLAGTVSAFCDRERMERWTSRGERTLAERAHSMTADGFMRALLAAAGID